MMKILKHFFNNDRECYGPVEGINQQLFEMAITRGKNIVFDRTGSDFKKYLETVISRLKTSGYSVNLVIVGNNYETALPRILKRKETEGRAVNEVYAARVYELLKIAIPQYLSLGCEFADKIFFYDNSDTLKLIYHTSCNDGNKKLNCVYNSGVCVTPQTIEEQSTKGGRKHKYKSSRKSKKIKKSKKTHRVRSYRTRLPQI